jgi:hypothetical protein
LKSMVIEWFSVVGCRLSVVGCPLSVFGYILRAVLSLLSIDHFNITPSE